MVLLVRAWERGDHSKFYDAHEIFVAEGVRGRGRAACENGGDKKSDVTMRQISGGGVGNHILTPKYPLS